MADRLTPVIDREIAALADANPWRRAYAARDLGALGDSAAAAVPALIRLLDDEFPQAVHCAALALGRIGGREAVAALIGQLAAEGVWTRWAAADGLAESGDAHAVPPLLAALDDEDETVRIRAIQALGRLGKVAAAAGALEALVARLNDKDRVLRQAAVRAVGELRHPDGFEPLLKQFTDRRYAGEVRVSAAQALGRWGDPRAAEALVAGLADRKAAVRSAAVEALGYLGDAAVEAGAVEGLAALIADADGWDRRRIHLALRALGVPEGLAAADDSSTTGEDDG